MAAVAKVVISHPDHGVTETTPSSLPALERRGWSRVTEPMVPVTGIDAAYLPTPDHPARNAGRDVWAEHARALGVDVADDAHRDEIIAAVEAADRLLAHYPPTPPGVNAPEEGAS